MTVRKDQIRSRQPRNDSAAPYGCPVPVRFSVPFDGSATAAPVPGRPKCLRCPAPTSGRQWWPGSDPPERRQEHLPERLVAAKLHVPLPAMRRLIGWQAEEPGPKAFRLRHSPAPGEPRRPDRMHHLVGQRAHGPEQMIPTEIVHRRLADRELVQLFDPLLHPCALVIETPGGERLDPLPM
jgi:hypothetical protein